MKRTNGENSHRATTFEQPVLTQAEMSFWKNPPEDFDDFVRRLEVVGLAGSVLLDYASMA